MSLEMCGRCVCIGNPKEITPCFAGYLVFAITGPQVRCVGEKYERLPTSVGGVSVYWFHTQKITSRCAGSMVGCVGRKCECP